MLLVLMTGTAQLGLTGEEHIEDLVKPCTGELAILADVFAQAVRAFCVRCGPYVLLCQPSLPGLVCSVVDKQLWLLVGLLLAGLSMRK